jgi:hypothetical protein
VDVSGIAGNGALRRADGLHPSVRVRWLFTAGFTLAVGLLIVLSLRYGHDLDYRFEVFVITIDWTVLIIAAAPLNVVFKRAGQAGGQL